VNNFFFNSIILFFRDNYLFLCVASGLNILDFKDQGKTFSTVFSMIIGVVLLIVPPFVVIFANAYFYKLKDQNSRPYWIIG
jgi:hypothetical protein